MKDGTKKPKIEKSTYKRGRGGGDVNCALRIKLECAACVYTSFPFPRVSLKSENGILERVVGVTPLRAWPERWRRQRLLRRRTRGIIIEPNEATTATLFDKMKGHKTWEGEGDERRKKNKWGAGWNKSIKRPSGLLLGEERDLKSRRESGGSRS